VALISDGVFFMVKLDSDERLLIVLKLQIDQPLAHFSVSPTMNALVIAGKER
jgi:hypothetical protein